MSEPQQKPGRSKQDYGTEANRKAAVETMGRAIYDFYRGPVAQNVTIRAWGVDPQGVQRVVYFEPGERPSYRQAKALMQELHGCGRVTGTERAA